MSYMDEVIKGYELRLAELEESVTTNPYAEGIVWSSVDNEFVKLSEARIPIQDEGFLHSDLAYDVPGVWDGRFFRLNDHMNRLDASLEKLRLKWPIPREEVKEKILEMLKQSGIKDAYVEIIVTRGFKYIRQHYEQEYPNNLYLIVMPYIFQLPIDQHEVGASAAVPRSVRRVPPGAIDPTIKNLQWGDLIRGVMEVNDRGARFPLMGDGDGNLTEGAGNNIFLVRKGVLYTAERGVLEGVTRKTVLEIAEKFGIEAKVMHVPMSYCYDAEEIFLSTTAGGIMPITSLDGVTVGAGKIGPITQKIWEEYWKLHYDPNFSFAVTY